MKVAPIQSGKRPSVTLGILPVTANEIIRKGGTERDYMFREDGAAAKEVESNSCTKFIPGPGC